MKFLKYKQHREVYGGETEYQHNQRLKMMSLILSGRKLANSYLVAKCDAHIFDEKCLFVNC